ncbi:MAG TPA: DNA ligase D [Candidatus Methylomirabilis sp.]|nr:DNA ligase D [Candidatus Methylomirabilis sp.]
MAKLEEYRKKRQFNRTPEPFGEPEPSRHPDEAAKPEPPKKHKRLPKPKLAMLEVPAEARYRDTFVVQKHSATRLHYDFRLAINGVLVSWAVPKGPSLNSADKRLAVQTEDHPLEYGGFEGKIPEGSYGAGTVMVWDRGTYAVENPPGASLDAGQQLRKGEIKFSLNGEKLRGGFVLVRIKRGEKGNEWLMIKHKDAADDPAWNIDEHDGSVLTGRVLDEIKQQLPPKRSPSPFRPDELQDAHKAAMPSRIEPMLASIGERPFSDANWLFEIKWDGVRALAWLDNGVLTLRARHGADITARYPEFAALPAALSARQAILDGEIAALDERGHSDFGRLQERMHVRAPAENLIARVPAVYFVFDLLYCDGYDLRRSPLIERKQLLQRLLHTSGKIRFSDHQLEKGQELFELAKQNSLEGIVAKRLDSIYVSERSQSWLKLKVTQTLDAVIGGWTAARTGALPLGSLLLGLYEGKKLRFIGHVGSGFDGKKLNELSGRLREFEAPSSPFDAVPETNEKPFWASPKLVARVKYSAWTQEGALRHPVFIALREDVNPADCQWEKEIAEAKATPADPGSPPAAVRAPEVVGRVITQKSQIEEELFAGRAETINIELDGKRLRFTNLNKIYFPESGYTKRNLLAYYYQVADYILPFLRERALVLRRYPDGIKGQAFFQKDIREGLPDWFKTVPIESEEKGKVINYATADDRASLLFLTGLGCMDHNPWSNRISEPEHPDYFFFDLDPSDGTEFSVVVTIAQALHKSLDELKLAHFLKTSGATGFHIYVPVEPVYTYEQLRTFGEIVAHGVTVAHPNLVTSQRIVAKRPAGRVLIDVQQNAHGRPLAAAYSVRAFPKAPVSTPVLPRELKTSLHPETLNMKTLPARLKEKGDLWADFWKKRQRLETAIELLSHRMTTRSKQRD